MADKGSYERQDDGKYTPAPAPIDPQSTALEHGEILSNAGGDCYSGADCKKAWKERGDGDVRSDPAPHLKA